ncbi:hypothetical protein N7532_006489 [Penicillium argentinense]|uniref:Xylanolytic transcriptional activator regulatory domain-containing protein n=1 Tax=Penicillium argentinense TaxID=1131581 RepID=A0A9W9FFX9_9EURO|nr:uncharacterized protein N7532_006489 [Penicillium argentinense]KAJ5099488.1 hypothetical protein N7532_006489 [Penicillium argentinense]
MRSHDIAGVKRDFSELLIASLDTPNVTNQIAANSVSGESHNSQTTAFQPHNAAMASLLLPNQHNSNSQTQARLPGWLENIVQTPNSSHGNAQSQTSLLMSNSIWDPTSNEAVSFGQYSQAPTWLADEHFDLNAMNLSVTESALGFYSPAYTTNEEHTNTVIQPPRETIHEHKEDQVRELWFTYVGTHTGKITPDIAAENVELDEQYRQNLSQRLQQRVPTEPLPSTEFLNLCTQLFFTHLNPVFPIVHAPTFRPLAKSSLLLLSICSIGSLFVGSNYAVTQRSIIFERLNKAILATWEKYLLGCKGEALAMTQAALIGQTFAMLLCTFHGTVTAWDRIYKMFDLRRATDRLGSRLETRTPEESWRIWAQAEEQIRLHQQDTEISELVLTHPLMRHDNTLTPLTASHDLWTAPNATQWRDILRRRAPRASPEIVLQLSNDHPQLINEHTEGFQSYTKLESISARFMFGIKISDTSQEIRRAIHFAWKCFDTQASCRSWWTSIAWS